MTDLPLSERAHDLNERPFGLGRHLNQAWYQWEAGEFLTLPEAYRKGRLEIRCPIELASGFSGFKIDDEVAHCRNDCFGRNTGQSLAAYQAGEIERTQGDPKANGDNKMMLVAFVQNLDRVKIEVPARIRLRRMNYVDDLWGGEVHLSCIDGTTKTLLCARERKPDSASVLCLTPNHSEAEVVERGPEIVDSISEQEGERLWHGVLGLDINQSLVGIFAFPNSEFERDFRKIVGYFPVKITDVLLGPLNF